MRSDAPRQRVLVDDDERVIADTLVLILGQIGFEATAAYNGKNAVETATAFMPDVVIMDIFMEGMNGIEASLQISAILPLCRVILFSGNTETAELLQEAEAHDPVLGTSASALLKRASRQLMLFASGRCGRRASLHSLRQEFANRWVASGGSIQSREHVMGQPLRIPTNCSRPSAESLFQEAAMHVARLWTSDHAPQGRTG
jgi:CheY-like chemotaxis protein